MAENCKMVSDSDDGFSWCLTHDRGAPLKAAVCASWENPELPRTVEGDPLTEDDALDFARQLGL